VPPAVTFIYGGAGDWMPARPGFEAAAALGARGVDAACLLTPGAGHNIAQESPAAFAAQVVARCA
jgi:pimeloyl-ACP methyl ester carboxylesterase